MQTKLEAANTGFYQVSAWVFEAKKVIDEPLAARAMLDQLLEIVEANRANLETQPTAKNLVARAE